MANPLFTSFRGWLINFGSGVKVMGEFVGKECSPIFAQRVFRTYRVIQLHSKLWSKRPLSKTPLVSFILLSLCDSKKKNKDKGQSLGEVIKYDELVEHMKDLNFIRDLTAASVVCPHCQDRLVVDKKIPNVKYCHCPETKSAYDKKVKGFAWTPFVETADLLIWRMEHPDRPGLYMYKVYGYYNDISAEDFLEAQLDLEYRKKWDDTVLRLDMVENDQDIKQDVIYWEMKWPALFSNRDYTFARRHLVDQDKNAIVIISKAVSHPSVPDKKGVHRVKEYWSVMQVQSEKSLKEPGVEFGLTYFDNPGVSLPQWLQDWASMTAIPEFLDKQRNAARIKAKKKRNKKKPQSLSSITGSSSSSDKDNMNTHPLSEHNPNLPSNSNPEDKDAKPNNSSSEILSQFFKEKVLQNAQCSESN